MTLSGYTLTTDRLHRGKLRLAYHYLDRVREAEAHFQNSSDAALAQYDEALQQSWQMLAWVAPMADHDEEMARLTSAYPAACPTLLQLRFTPHEALAAHTRGLAAAQRLGDVNAEMLHLEQLGLLSTQIDALDQAARHFQRALRIAHKTGHTTHAASVLHGLAQLAIAQGKMPKARRYLRLSLSLVRPEAQPGLVADNFMGLSLAARQTQTGLDVIFYAECALEIARSIGDRRREAGILADIANALVRFDTRYAEARRYALAALDVYQGLNDKPAVANGLRMLGAVDLYLGEFARAADYFSSAAAAWQRLGSRRREGGALSELAVAVHGMGDSQRALRLFDEAINLFESIDYAPGITYCVAEMGKVYIFLGEYAYGKALLHVGIEGGEMLGYEGNNPEYTCAVGDADLLMGDIAAAVSRYETALAVARQRQLTYIRCECLCRLAIALLIQKQQPERIAALIDEAENLAQSMQSPPLVLSVKIGRAAQKLATNDIENTARLISEVEQHPAAICPDVAIVLRLMAIAKQ